MSSQRKFYEGLDVEVWIEKRNTWVRGHVLAVKTGDDGATKYFIQLSGYMAASPDDPHTWFAEDVIRSLAW